MEARALTWRDLQRSAALGQAVMGVYFIVGPLVGGGAASPEAAVIAVLAGVAWWWAGRPGKGGSIFAGVLSILLFLLVLVLFAGFKTLAHPDSTIDFIGIFGFLVVTVLGVVAFGPGLDPRRPLPGGEVVVRVAGVVLGLGIVLSVIAGLTTTSAEEQAGDTKVVAKDFAWKPKKVSVPTGGRVAFFVVNDDPSLHNFTIDGVVQEALPANKDRRVELDLKAGTYPFRCTLHSGMDGTIVVH